MIETDDPEFDDVVYMALKDAKKAFQDMLGKYCFDPAYCDIRFTAFVNDTTECNALQKEPNLFIDSDFTNQYVWNQWNTFIKSPDTNDNTYIASFSRGEESLEQWRAYGNFRIGFDAKKLNRSPFNLYQCVYLKEKIKNWILSKSKVKEWNADFLDDNFKNLAAFELIYIASRKYKNKYFQIQKL